MSVKITARVGSTLGLLALGLWLAPAQAALMSCTSNIADNVSGATDCQISSETNDNPAPGLVNSEGFFGITTWEYGGKAEFDVEGNTFEAGDVDVGFSASSTANSDGDFLSGLYSIGDFDLWESVMLIFKDGKDTTLVGYLLGTGSGSWESPFENPPFDVNNTKSVSHISAYVSGPLKVPEPASLAMLATGLVAVIALRRRRRPGLG